MPQAQAAIINDSLISYLSRLKIIIRLFSCKKG